MTSQAAAALRNWASLRNGEGRACGSGHVIQPHHAHGFSGDGSNSLWVQTEAVKVEIISILSPLFELKKKNSFIVFSHLPFSQLLSTLKLVERGLNLLTTVINDPTINPIIIAIETGRMLSRTNISFVYKYILLYVVLFLQYFVHSLESTGFVILSILLLFSLPIPLNIRVLWWHRKWWQKKDVKNIFRDFSFIVCVFIPSIINSIPWHEYDLRVPWSLPHPARHTY